MKRFALVVLFVLLVCHAFAEEKRVSLPLNDSPSLGPSDARVTIVEFIDFQ